MSEYVDKVKHIQRADPLGRAAWGKFCDDNGHTIRDPNKHDPHFLHSFIVQYEAGAFVGLEVPQVTQGGATIGLAELFKEGQRNSGSFRECWTRYQGRRGMKLNDPFKADKDSLVQFLEFVGIQGLMALSMMDKTNNYDNGLGKGNMGWKGPPAASTGEACWSGDGGMGWKGCPPNASGEASWSPSGEVGNWGGCDGGFDAGFPGGCDGGFCGGPPGGCGGSFAPSWGAPPAAKRQKGMPANTGDPYKDALVEKIKAFQRCGDEQKQAWWNFAENQPSKMRDPARHEVPALQFFLSSHGIEMPQQAQQAPQAQQALGWG